MAMAYIDPDNMGIVSIGVLILLLGSIFYFIGIYFCNFNFYF